MDVLGDVRWSVLGDAPGDRRPGHVHRGALSGPPVRTPAAARQDRTEYASPAERVEFRLPSDARPDPVGGIRSGIWKTPRPSTRGGIGRRGVFPHAGVCRTALPRWRVPGLRAHAAPLRGRTGSARHVTRRHRSEAGRRRPGHPGGPPGRPHGTAPERRIAPTPRSEQLVGRGTRGEGCRPVQPGTAVRQRLRRAGFSGPRPGRSRAGPRPCRSGAGDRCGIPAP